MLHMVRFGFIYVRLSSDLVPLWELLSLEMMVPYCHHTPFHSMVGISSRTSNLLLLSTSSSTIIIATLTKRYFCCLKTDKSLNFSSLSKNVFFQRVSPFEQYTRRLNFWHLKNCLLLTIFLLSKCNFRFGIYFFILRHFNLFQIQCLSVPSSLWYKTHQTRLIKWRHHW